MSVQVGDRVSGRDEFYDCDLAGVVVDVSEMRTGEREVFFVNELPGRFQGKRVALPEGQLSTPPNP